MDTKKFKFNNQAIKYLTDRVNQYRETLEKTNPPPMLQGIEAEAKCPRCYFRKECFKLADKNGEIYNEF